MKQLTLGELLNLIKNIPTEWSTSKDPVSIRFDFGTMYPTGFSSSRGDYSEVAINYNWSGYDGEQLAKTTLKDFVKMLKKEIGTTETGWKGGEFLMTKNTPVWVDNDGNWSSTAVVGVINNTYEVILLTEYQKE